MNLAIIALVAAIFSFPQVAHEQAPDGVVFSVTAGFQEQKKEPVEQIPGILAKIAACESRDRHFDENGKIVKGRNKYDIGKYQINVLYWGNLAAELGHDIYTEKGNEAMALELYRRYGTSPWNWSKACWSR